MACPRGRCFARLPSTWPTMNRLTHFRLCPISRYTRLAMSETGLEAQLVEEPAWEQRPQLLALNPAGELPVLELERGLVLCGPSAIGEYLAEEARARGHDIAPGLLPHDREDRAEARRLVDWCHRKLDREVTREMLIEKVYVRLSGRTEYVPDPDVLRAARANLRYHMSYLAYLAHQRRWLAGEDLSLADLAAAAHLSCLDYIGEVPWDDYPVARGWYARLKSRPSFRALLADRIPGLPPPLHYTDLDF